MRPTFSFLGALGLFAVVFGLAATPACNNDPTGVRILRVDLRTDYVPVDEFDGVRLVIGEGDLAYETDRIVRREEDYVRGQRLGETTGPAGSIPLTVTLFKNAAPIITRRAVALPQSDITVVTVVITRDCEDVTCPNDNPAFIGCLGGQCVDPRCTVEHPEFCPTAECGSDADCASAVNCLRAQCTSGVCLDIPDDSQCSTGTRCSATMGCIATVQDAGAQDAGVDSSLPDTSMPDTNMPDTSGPDTSVPTVTCSNWNRGEFTFDVVGQINTGGVVGERQEAKLSTDLQSLYFAHDRRVWEAPRIDDTNFGPATPIAGLDGTPPVLGAVIRSDGLEAIAMRIQDGERSDFWIYSRARPSGAFTEGRELTELNTADSEWDAFLSWDGLRLYASQVVDQAVLIHAARADLTSPFTGRTIIIPSEHTQAGPTLTYDEHTIAFNRVISGVSRIYYSTRSSTDETFGQPRRVPGIPVDAWEPYLSPDGCRIIYVQNVTELHLARYREL